jgi:quercetin dioxygenase-like cupin family protein
MKVSMQLLLSAIATLIVLSCIAFVAPLTRVVKSASDTKATPLILASDQGERRDSRTRPGMSFTVKVDPKNGGSEHMVVVTEDMAPGDIIPTHRHPHADELILIQSGTGKVTLGDHVQEARAGAIVFIPRDTWIGVENVGKDHLTHTDVFSAPGFEEYMRSISVPAGDPIVPLSKADVEERRMKYAHYEIYR